MVGRNLHGGTVLTVPIHIVAEGKVALYGDLIALVQILSNGLSHAAPDGNAIEDGDVIAIGVLLAGIGSLREGSTGNVVDVGKYRIGSQSACGDDQIHAHS